jgi:NADH:ubiquinone oxidoreductase subunit 6 (subunit J)
MLIQMYDILLLLIGLSGLGVILARSPVHSVIFLCGVYLLGGIIFFILDHYFIALTLIIVYVGAIAILFLFTVLMINIRLTIIQSAKAKGFSKGSLKSGLWNLLFLILLFNLFILFKNSTLSTDLSFSLINNIDWSNLFLRNYDFHLLGYMIYNSYSLALILAGFLLLIVMIAIIKIHLNDKC